VDTKDYGGLRFYTLTEILHEFLGQLPAEIGLLLSAANVLSQEIVAMSSPGTANLGAHDNKPGHVPAKTAQLTLKR
jgi:hypothetical protein